MTRTIISVPRKQVIYWTIQWDKNSLMTTIQNNSLWTYVMKCDNEMVECLFDLQRRFDSLHPEGKHHQNLKRCMEDLYCNNSNDTIIKEALTPTQNRKNCSKKQLSNSSIFPPKCAELAWANLLMSPLTSPNDHSTLKPAPSIETNKSIEESDSDMTTLKDLTGMLLLCYWI